jgi:predicted alpha-1,2-mannosidase
MGQFAMGNEPSFHIPYIYDYLGVPWKAQKRLRDCMDIWFTNSETGICGDEDGGAMSSWLVFSALGFFPVCPGKAEYAIGTPLFDSAEIQLENGKTFKVKSDGAGDGLRYIQSATLNGKSLPTPFLTHEEIMSGGELVLIIGRKPKLTW